MTRAPLRTALVAAGALATFAASAQIVIYENDNYNGRSFRATNSVSNLADNGFNDRASSVSVQGGRWQLCDDAYFGGRCVTVGPGQYDSLRSLGMNDRVSSVRSLGWTPDGSGGWGNNNNNNQQWGGNNSWGSGDRAVLYSSYNLSGESFVVSPAGMNNLDRAGFNDKARSLRIESGYWIFCSDANFQGNCHTYGPGDYPNLPSGQAHSISSGRRVSNNYPYRSNPNWGGGNNNNNNNYNNYNYNNYNNNNNNNNYNRGNESGRGYDSINNPGYTQQ